MRSGKNIQVIDGARNCAYDIYRVSEDDFELIFGGAGQNIAFSDELSPEALEALGCAWTNRVEKHEANGIHGTIFYELAFKKEYYPNRREADLDGWARPS